MRKRTILLAVLALVHGFDVYGVELYWYVAASLSKPGREVADRFNRENESIDVYVVVGGSGQLLSKLYLSKKGDFYTPASEAFLKKAESYGIVKSHRLLLKQKPVFGLSTSGAETISKWEDLVRPGIKIALGNPGTMALAKTYLSIEKKMDGKTAQGIRLNMAVAPVNVTQVVNYLLSNIVDAGILFDTVARANGIPYLDIPENYNCDTSAYLARLRYSKNIAAADKFEDFVLRRKEIFDKHGFKLE
ncbi:MAG: solute-binding protein [Proteobacteria bacterium]|nr:solute-binding protein [Pseudomonadota bacterium]